MQRIRFVPTRINRRGFLAGTAMGAGLVAAGGLLFPRPGIAQSGRPVITHGVQSGDISAGRRAGQRAVIWSRADRPSRLHVEWSTTESFAETHRVQGPAALPETDLTAKLDLDDLPAGQHIFYRVQFQDLGDVNVMSEPVIGSFRTAPGEKRDINFVWTGDTCGQGWGINLDWGGMKGYATMLANDPAFMIHSGDNIYADGPIQEEVTLADGTLWRNVVTEEKSKVAETLDDFRGNYKYNLTDTNVLAFNAAVPVFSQWDDHETVNNWYPNEVLLDDRYTERSVALLSARSNRAFQEFMPTRQFAMDPERIHRTIHYGPSLDVFFLDMRRFRGNNSPNAQQAAGGDAAFLGDDQIAWLKTALLNSRATWKVIAADMPIGIIVRDGETDFENSSNGDGPVLGREHDIAEVLRFIHHNGIKNTVWLTADVHYTAAHYYDPNKAQFQDFSPFWEFVSGPIHAGSFGPGDMDNTFGPQVMYSKDPAGEANLPPSAGLQFFGHVHIDGATEVMTVTLKDIADQDLWSIDLQPEV
ncbi:MAG: alkaline phosphatase D family protein [Rhodospirillaceae bacterium]|nr:alkaline phosphatase D family protein [Rhodospirillaceae bacterium]